MKNSLKEETNKDYFKISLKKLFCLPLVLLLLASLAILSPESAYSNQAKKGNQSAATKNTSNKKAAPKKTATKNTNSKKSAKKSAKKSGKKGVSKKKAPVNVANGNNFKGAAVYNVTKGETIFSRRADHKVAPASLTKVLSMYLVMDAISEGKIDLHTKTKISPRAAGTGGSSMGLRSGDLVSLEELLYGMAVCSGNDASVAVAELIGDSEDNFVKLMNKKARSIGMNNSVFKNAHGLPAKGQLTTASDMLILAHNYLKDYPANLKKFHSNTRYTYAGRTVKNSNSLLGSFEGADGLKTGYVAASGFNLISTAKRENTRLIAVLLGAPNKSIREQETAALLNKGFKQNKKPSVDINKSASKSGAKNKTS